jgi:hypothetical protein
VLHCGNKTKCIVTGVCICLKLLYALGHQHMKTLKNLWVGVVEDEDENECFVFFYMVNLLQHNISCEHL